MRRGRVEALSRLGLLTSGVLVAGLLQVGPPVSATPAPAPLTGQAKALTTAKDTGQPTEVPELTTETSQTFANPDGTFTAELAAAPVRARHADGSWSAIDFTVRPAPDGTLRPVSAPYSAALSGGGAGPLVELVRDGKSLALTWPGVLPAPVVDGATVTYPNVLPDVDLRASLDVHGFSEVLVVKNRQAAANPALAKVRFAMATTNVTVDGDNGSFSAVDRDGNQVFGSGTPTMWDSGVSTGPAKSGPAHQVAMSVTASPDALEVTPSQALLTAADTVYPLYIDPSVSVLDQWSMINERFPDQSYWGYDRTDGAKVGYVADPGDGWERYRSMFRFPTTAFAHKHVTNAMFSITITHSWSCSASQNQLYHIADFGPATTWHTHAGTWDQSLTTQTSVSCDDAHKRVEFAGGQLTPKVQAAANGSPIMPLGLKATNESTINSSWKKFDGDTARLNVTYNTVPNAPTGMDVAGKGCGTGDKRAYVGETTPTVSAYVSDPDAGQLLSAGIYYGELGSTSFIGSVTAANIPAGGARLSGPVPAGKLADGHTYYLEARGYDGIDVGPWSAVCEFAVDTVRPDKPPIVSSVDYPNDDSYHGGVGRTGRFTFAANGVPDIYGYRYSFSGCEPNASTEVLTSTVGGDVSVPLTPTSGGQTTLCVRSEDHALNVSDPVLYRFNTGRPTDPVAHYTADDGTGQTLADSSGNNHPATLAGGTTWVAGHTPDDTDKAVHFDGVSGSASSVGPVVRTDRSFTVSTWVRVPSVPTATSTVVSSPGFALQYRADSKHWVFAVGGVVADSGVGPVAGGWVHLAGMYDSVKGEARLFANGTSGPPAAVPTSSAASGPLVVGSGSGSAFLAGDVDDVQVWDRVVVDDELLAMINDPVLRGRWDFDENAGTIGHDSSGLGADATLTPGASWTRDRDGIASAVLFSGTNSYAQTATPVVRTDQSFSVAAWVRLDNTGSWTTFVSQDGNRNSAFYLQYRIDTKKWAFSVRAGDTDGAAVTSAHASTPPVTDQWTALVGVYDAVRKEIRIYVGGTLAGSAKVPANWNAAGPLAIGRGKNGGGLGDLVHGAVDAVQVYSGVLSGRDIADYARGPNG